MLTSRKALADRLGGISITNWCLWSAALFTFLGMAFGPFGSYLFEELMIIPCVVFLYTCLSRPVSSGAKKALGLSLVMMAWFLFLQILRDLAYFEVYPFGTYFCSYFFAFPLACLLQDGEKKQALKLFAAAFIAASLCHTLAALLLLLDLIPAYFAQHHVLWTSARLNVFWHPNMAACFHMFGIASCIAFLQDAKKGWHKLALLAVSLIILATMALTNCRTVIILVGGILGGAAFYSIIRGRWKLAPIALVSACIILLLTYYSCGILYKTNSDTLYARYLAESIEEPSSQESPAHLAPNIDSAQKSLAEDMSTFNSRTDIWYASYRALTKNPLYPIIGVDNPGRHMSHFYSVYQTHTHNSWVETMLGLGVPGFVIAMIFTLLTLWNGIVILLKYPLDVRKRTTAMLTLCMLVASFMEPYLFLPPIDYYIYNFIFLLCAGYLVHWQEEDNRKFLSAVRKFLHI